MKRIDAEHMEHPAKGVVGMTAFLLEEGYMVGLRKVRRIMRLMGIMPVLQGCQFTARLRLKHAHSTLKRGSAWTAAAELKTISGSKGFGKQ